MHSEIVQAISKQIPLTVEEAAIVHDCIPVKTFEKNTILLEVDQVARASYFNLSGLVRKYMLIDGNEVTIEFYEEGASIASLTSLQSGKPSKHCLQCIETCRLAVLTKEKEAELLKRVPQYEALCRQSLESNFGRQQDQLANYLSRSPEERYLQLIQEKPQLLHRVALQHLATYIGVKPESLSRIRKRGAKKKL